MIPLINSSWPATDLTSSFSDWTKSSKASSKCFRSHAANDYRENITGGDVEAVTDLLRRMYDTDLAIWGLKNTDGVEDCEREELGAKADALLAEVRQIVDRWRNPSRRTWEDAEKQEWEKINTSLTRGLKEKRYGE